MERDLLCANTGRVQVCAHRGHSAGAPENTLTAMALARRLGADFCEIDVVRSADGVVVLHDSLLDRTTDGRGLVAERSNGEIRRLDAGGWFGDEFAGEPVPTLQDALALAREQALGLIVEIKERYRFETHAFLEDLAGIIAEAGSTAEVVLASFDEVALRIAKEVMPQIRTELITHCRFADPVSLLKRSRIDALNMNLDRFHPGDASALHEAGIAVRVTLPDAAELSRFETYGLGLRARLGAWLRQGLVDVLASDDTRVAAELVDQYPLEAAG